MDTTFLNRLNAKIRQHLSFRVLPDPLTGLRAYAHVHLKQNGDLLEDVLSLVRRYWERAQPSDIDREGAAHEQVLMKVLAEDRKLLEDSTTQLIAKQPHLASDNPTRDIDIHYEVYSTKVRDEIAFLQAVRRHEIADQRKSWLIGAAIPVACVLLSAWLANDARTTLKEVDSVRSEMAGLARSSLVASALILDGADRISAPAHKLAAQKRMREVEIRLTPFFPGIHAELKAAITEANAEAERFWKRYEKLPQSKRDQYYQEYLEGRQK